MNELLEDLIYELNDHGLAPSDVLWVGFESNPEAREHRGVAGPYAPMHWDSFVEYVSTKSWDIHELAFKNFVVVGEDWWLEPDDECYDWKLRRWPVRLPDGCPRLS